MTILEKQSLHPSILGLLMFIKQNNGKSEYITEMLRTRCFEFELSDGTTPSLLLETNGWIKYVKSGKKDPWFRVRLSDAGSKLLKELDKEPENELALYFFNKLSEAYKNIDMESKVVNKTKTLYYMSEFLNSKSNYNEKMIDAVVKSYVDDFDYERRKYMNNTLTLLFKSSNAYATKWSPEDCPLWTWIENNSDKLKRTYAKL